MVATLITLAFAPGPIVVVSPTGPVRTLAQALAQVAGKPGARIQLRTGDYRLTETVRLGKEHSGLTIEAAPGARPVLLGGISITGWRAEEDRWVASVPESVSKSGSRLLRVGGEMRPRSRWPAKGELLNENVFDVPWMSTTGGGWKRKPTDQELTMMRFRAGDLGDWLDPASAEITVVHMWDESCVGVATVDLAKREVTFSSPTGHPPGAFGVQKYIVWNTERGLTQPGQWFLDRRTNRLVYRPKPGERPDRTEASLGTLDRLIFIDGASGVTVRGLRLEVANVPLKSGGFGAGEYDGALMATDAPDLTVDNVTVANVAGTGIRTWNCARLRVRGCTVQSTGAGGIRAEGEQAQVLDNVVRDTGLQYPSAIGIWGGGKGSRFAHNRITDTSYSAMIAGGEGTVIEANRIARAMKVLHDGAGIYVGFTKNVTLRGNWISDIVDTGGYGVSAYYLDEQAENCEVVGNVATGVGRPSQNHMARGNVLRNNLFVFEGEMRLDFARCAGYRLIDNVLAATRGVVFSLPADGWAAFSGNVLDAGDAPIVRRVLDQYAETSKGDLSLPLGNRTQRLRVTQSEPGLFRVNTVPARQWDVRSAGPRPAASRR